MDKPKRCHYCNASSINTQLKVISYNDDNSLAIYFCDTICKSRYIKDKNMKN